MDKSLSASELNRLGQTAFQKEQFQEAARLYQQAVEACQTTGDALATAEMKNNLSVALIKAGDPNQALAAVIGTDEIFANAGDYRRQAIALGNLASAYEAIGELQKACEHYQRSADFFKQVGEHDLRVFTLQSLSALQLRMGSQFEAMATMDCALAEKKNLSLRERFLKKLLRVPFRMLGS